LGEDFREREGVFGVRPVFFFCDASSSMDPKLFVRGYSVFFDTKWVVRGLGRTQEEEATDVIMWR
jgi:hypothetical protein